MRVPSKEQREWSNWIWRVKKKPRKKLFKKTQTGTERLELLKALEGLR